VTYATKVDLGTRSFQFLDRAGMFRFRRHDEYGGRRARHRRGGRNEAFTWLLLANTGYCEIRYEDRKTWESHARSSVTSRMTIRSEPLPSGLFRGGGSKGPRTPLLGVMYEKPNAYISLLGADTSEWLFSGTGFKPAIRFQGWSVEYDRPYANQAIIRTHAVGRSPS